MSPSLKILELAADEAFSELSLLEALKKVEPEPHDGWADLLVHPSMLRRTLKIANAHNLTKSAIKLRVGCETRMGMDDWKLRTRSVELRVERERA